MKEVLPDRGSRPAARERRRRVGPVLVVACLTFACLAGTGGAAMAGAGTPTFRAGVTPASYSVTPSVDYPYACTTTFVGGAVYTGGLGEATVTELFNGPGVHTYPGGPVAVQLQVVIPVGSAATNALLGIGTSSWTSTDARLVWGPVTSPATPFAWQVAPVPQFPERYPITFTTAPFLLPGPGDVAPGALSWDFQANAGVQPGFGSGHVQCTPIAPVQVYATFLAASGPSCAHVWTTWTCRFSYTGSTQLWQVPADVSHVTIEARGASGRAGEQTLGSDVDRFWPGGRGGASVATIPVTQGEYLMVTSGGSNGFNGGGAGKVFDLSGGGASDVRRAPYGPTERLVVAGGGGGGGFDVFCFGGCPDDSGGAGGGLSGVSGGSAGAAPGTQTGGGVAGTSGEPAFQPTSGTLGTGGDGATGGGGGYYGGAGAGTAPDEPGEIGGGGGGSGFVPPGPASSTTAGASSGDGSVAITYTSATTPYTSHYTAGEATGLLAVQTFLHRSDLAGAQHDAALFLAFLGFLTRLTGATPPDLGSAPGTGPVAVTSTYTRAENALLLRGAALYRSDAPTLQHSGAALLARLVP